jgi:NADH dehydrogenase [ubiquinone] 1 alpha subcomplex assembly factor 7
MTYDSEARRDTPLALTLKERICRDGPISVAQYMEACLQDPEHGYYRNKAAIGAKADFITAPEISQVFGELIGLWCAVVWQQAGSPSKVNLVELGPGRGTLMRDALRAARIVPGFRDALAVHLVESNDSLLKVQAETLADCTVPLSFHARLDDMLLTPEWGSGAPSILIGNEFLDTYPVHQAEWRDGAWHERKVGLDASSGALQFTADMTRGFLLRFAPDVPSKASDTIYETCSASATLARSDLHLLSRQGALAALFIDYGHTDTALGETLQAVRGHKAEHPLTSPGEADLTAQVDFASFADAARAGGCIVDGLVPQAEFLGALGIMQRAAKLMAANPIKSHEIEMGVARLMAVPGMGDRFKVIGIRSANLPPLPGFG